MSLPLFSPQPGGRSTTSTPQSYRGDRDCSSVANEHDIFSQGKAELVVQDTGSHQKFLEVAERVAEPEALQEAVEEMKAGKGTPIEEMFEEMQQVLARKKSR
jgi:hypothetical protein